MNIDYRLIGSRIKDTRKHNNLTQEYLAESLGVSVGYVSQVERGITKISLDLLANIASVLNCDIAELVTGSAISGENYLSAEIISTFKKLSSENKRLVLGFIRMLSSGNY